MFSKDEAWNFAHEWIDAWNSRDIEKIMKHYADSIEFCSPFVQKTVKDSGGVIRGFSSLQSYITTNMQKISNFNFELIDVLTSPQSIVLYYKINHSLFAAEVMLLNSEMKATKVYVNYEPFNKDGDFWDNSQVLIS